MVKKTEQTNIILNGRAALCAGRDDMSSEDEADDSNVPDSQHRFAKPDHFKTVLESGAIPDAAMIHEARKKRQKARELGKPNLIHIEMNMFMQHLILFQVISLHWKSRKRWTIKRVA